jgi:hypothetical protein
VVVGVVVVVGKEVVVGVVVVVGKEVVVVGVVVVVVGVVAVEVGVVAVVDVDVDVDVLGAGAVMALVASDVAGVDPFLFVAVTETRRVRVRSASPVWKVELTAPAIATQAFPAASQRSH